MKRIYKYGLSFVSRQIIMLPRDFQILSVKNQNESLEMWAAVDPDKELTERTILVVNTGDEIWPGREVQFLDSVMLRGGKTLKHVFLVL